MTNVTQMNPPTAPNVHVSPPGHLSDEAKLVWDQVVNARAPDWFQPDSLPLLEEYCNAIVTCRQLSAMVDRAMAAGLDDVSGLLRDRDREAKRVSSLATKMRLTNQSRYTPDRAVTKAKQKGGAAVWQFGANKTK